MIYILTQYGQLYGAFTCGVELEAWVKANIPAHLRSEYRVHAMPLDTIFVPGADNQVNLKDVIE